MGDIRVDLKADNTDLRTKFAQADKAAERFAEKLGKVGLSAFGLSAVVNVVSGIVDAARNLTGVLDENEAAAQRFVKALDGGKEAATGLGVTLLGALNRAGEYVGKQIAIVKYGREQVELTEEIAAQTERTLAALEKDEKITKEKGRLNKEAKQLAEQLADVKRGELSTAEQVADVEREYLELRRAAINAGEKTIEGREKLNKAAAVMVELAKLEVKERVEIAKAEEKLADERKKDAEELAKLSEELAKLKFQELSATEQLQKLLQKSDVLQSQIYQAKIKGHDTTKLEIDLLKTTNLLADARSKSTNELIEAERKVTAEIEKQITARRVAFSISGDRNEDQSTRSLEKQLREVTRQISAIERQNLASRNADPYNPLEGIARAQKADIERELAARRTVGRNINTLGEERAFNLFGGSEAEFERLARTLSEQPAQKETVRLLGELNDRLRPIFPKG